MKVYAPNKDLAFLQSNLTLGDSVVELLSIEEHDKQLLAAVKERLMHYKPQIVEDIGICVSATLLDFFEHIPDELQEKLEEQ